MGEQGCARPSNKDSGHLVVPAPMLPSSPPHFPASQRKPNFGIKFKAPTQALGEQAGLESTCGIGAEEDTQTFPPLSPLQVAQYQQAPAPARAQQHRVNSKGPRACSAHTMNSPCLHFSSVAQLIDGKMFVDLCFQPEQCILFAFCCFRLFFWFFFNSLKA